VPVAGRGVGAEMGPRMHGGRGGGEGGQYIYARDSRAET
jgi:hypothetical protein